MALLKNIYHELQSRSKDSHPFADFDTVVSTLAEQCMRIVDVPAHSSHNVNEDGDAAEDNNVNSRK